MKVEIKISLILTTFCIITTPLMASGQGDLERLLGLACQSNDGSKTFAERRALNEEYVSKIESVGRTFDRLAQTNIITQEAAAKSGILIETIKGLRK